MPRPDDPVQLMIKGGISDVADPWTCCRPFSRKTTARLIAVPPINSAEYDVVVFSRLSFEAIYPMLVCFSEQSFLLSHWVRNLQFL